MIGEPLRWFFMLCVAACGYFTITSASMDVRAIAFIGSAVAWQGYCVILMYEADMLRNSGMKRKEREKAALAASGAPQPSAPSPVPGQAVKA
jgi:hypothetical protein